MLIFFYDDCDQMILYFLIDSFLKNVKFEKKFSVVGFSFARVFDANIVDDMAFWISLYFWQLQLFLKLFFKLI